MNKKLLITGASGLVGNAFRRLEGDYPEFEFIFATRHRWNLLHQDEVEKMFLNTKPDYVIHTAGRVGGIGRNLNSPAQQFTDNTLMNTLVIDEAHKAGIKKLIAFSSVCAFPANASIITENNLHDGEPFPAHRSYAYSKRMVDIQLDAYKKQYGMEGCSVVPGNIYGPSDNFNLEDGHIIPSLVHKGLIAKNTGTRLPIWGRGTALREFIYVEDLARVCLELLLMDKPLPARLLVSGEEKSIFSIAGMIMKLYGLPGIEFDTSKPEGQLRRQTDKTLFNSIFPDFVYTPIEKGLEETVEWFENAYPNVRQ